jgi:multidrug resistance efflux pump
MEVRHERPDPDMSYRLKAPLTLGLPDGSAVAVREWSLRGCLCPDLAGKPLDGLVLSIPFQGIGVYFTVSLAASDAPDEYLWRGLTGRQRETLALFYRNLMSGRMTSTQEMIVSLDTPVDLVPMEETEAERSIATARVSPRPVRALTSLLSYSVMFVMVFGFLAYVAMDRLNRVPVISAKAAALSVPLIARGAGVVTEALVTPGTIVEEGTPLLRIEDFGLRMARREVQEQLSALAERVTQAEARLASHMQGRQAARANFGGGLDRFDAGVSLAPGDFHDLRKQFEADLATARTELGLAEARFESTQAQTDAMVIRAPARGSVLNFRDPLLGLTQQGERLASFEYDEPRAVLAWIDPEQVAAIWPGMSALVQFNRNGRIYTIHAQVAGLTMQGQGEDALIQVTLSLSGMAAGETRAWLEPDSPVTVQLKTDRLRRWLGLGVSTPEVG